MLRKISESVQPITMGQHTTAPVPTPRGPEQNQQLSAIKDKVAKAVSESGDLVKALECVGAMYGIPSTNIISDPAATGIRVVNDNIIAPPIEKPISQIKPIMAAIGSVLDYISQRIDDKLNEYHHNNIQQGRIEDSMANANPNKGKVVGRYVDDEGGEILAYDSGAVDMPNTPAARTKVSELRANNTIPSYTLPGVTSPSYFSEDEEDISAGVDMDATSDESSESEEFEETDIAEEIQESAYHLRMVSKFNNTTHLGYDMLQKHGFDFIKPIDSFIQESKTEDDSDDNKKKKNKVHASDIKHMKFDNKEILKAVKYFNEARDDQDHAKNGSMDIEAFINNPNYEKAIECLNKQFDCRINLRFFKTRDGKYENAGTLIYNDLKKKLTVSKSKGFQLGGLPISIEVHNHYFENSAPEDIELFGQNMVSTICHEIFHNIASVLRKENARVGMSLTMTLNIASNAKTIKDRRIIITNYVNTLEDVCGSKIVNHIAKRKLVKQLMTLTTVQDNEALVQQIQKSAGKDKDSSEKYIDNLIKKYKKITRENKPRITRYIFPVVAAAASITSCILMPVSDVLFIARMAFSAMMGMGIIARLSLDTSLISLQKQYSKMNLYEEYYCDLFAGMYKLPKFFFIGPSKKKYVSNDFSDEKISELAVLEKEFFESIFCKYPTDLERTHAGVKIAKNLLKDKDLDQSTRKYCQWIVDNFSNMKNSNIDEIYNRTTFDPKEADDLDKHLEDLIKDNNIVLTESFKQWLNSDEIINQ